MFSRTKAPGSSQVCTDPCKEGRQSDADLSTAVQQRIKLLTGRDEPATGRPATDDSPMMIPADASRCRKMAMTLGPTLRRFNRYREALPYARSANDMNDRLGEHGGKSDKSVKAPCLTRLPTDAATLCEELGLKPGTIKDEDLRNENTGFRAALYRDETTGKVILVARDTQPTSLVDWQTNTRNGEGRDTDQYTAMVDLSRRLTTNGVDFDIAGYSKGGGLAQEAGLVNPKANVYVFNAAGLHERSLSRTGSKDFTSLMDRTRAFSAENDFLTFMNETTDPQEQIANVEFLRRELRGENRWGLNPMKIDHRNPDTARNGNDDTFAADLERYFTDELDPMIEKMRQDVAAGRPIRSFPPVRSNNKEVVVNSMSGLGKFNDAGDPGPNFGKLVQHQMSNVLGPMEDSVKADRKTLERFTKECP